jgi:glucose/arabinose dehydrogenase
MRFATRTFRLGAAIVFAILAGVLDAGAQTLPTGFVLQPIAVDVFEPGRPVGFTELPDGRFLIIERNSGIVRLHTFGNLGASIIHIVTGITIQAERGLLGVAVDPDWPARPYVYLFYTYTGSVSRLTMYTAVGELQDPHSTNLTLTNPFQLLTDIPDSSDIHNGGTLRFGSDGMLYVSLGNDGNPCNSQDLTLLSGGILRLDVSGMPTGGSGPPPKSAITPIDNPFPGPNENEKLHYTWGLRNPFRFNVDLETNDLYIGDVGGALFEEIDRVPDPTGGGQNFGWPHREGFIDPNLGYNCGIGNSFTDPIYAYPHGAAAAVICGPMYRVRAGDPLAFPAEYEGSVFLADFIQNWIRRIVFDGSSWVVAPPVPGQPSATNWGESFGVITDMQLGSDGALYFMKLIPAVGAPSGLYRIAPSTAIGIEGSVASGAWIRATPNPADGHSGISIQWQGLLHGARSLGIFDSAGRAVQTWQFSERDRTTGAVFWDGRAHDRRAVPSGVYFYSLQDGGGVEHTGKIVLLR